MKRIISVIIPVFITLIFYTCSSPLTENDGTITIDLNKSLFWAADPTEELGNMDFTITLSGSGSTITEHINGQSPLSILLSAGAWHITITATGDRPDKYDSMIFPSERMLLAMGEADFTVKEEINPVGRAINPLPVSITMNPATEISNWAQLKEAFSKAGASPEIVIVTGNISVNELIKNPFDMYDDRNVAIVKAGQNIILRAEKNVTIKRADSSPHEYDFFRIMENGSLTLEGRGGTLTISGNNKAVSYPLIQIGNGISGKDGCLVMNEGTHITANYSDQTAAISAAGTFTMNGGTISHNTNDRAVGGGVSVSGTFNMYGGTIHNNKIIDAASIDETFWWSSMYGGGGGVVVEKFGTFTMYGGTITNNSVCSNKISRGGGVYVYGGTFYMKGNAMICNNKCDDAGFNIPNAYGGGVYVSDNGKFYMSENADVFGNLAKGNNSSRGGGVYINGSGNTFEKTGNSRIFGLMIGITANIVDPDYMAGGHAVYYTSTRYKNSTAGPGVNLSLTSSANWDY